MPLPLHAVVRLPRTAAVRRALLVVVFLGGFLALGFVLGGGTAHAAESERGTSSASAAGLLGGAGESASSAVRQTVGEMRWNASMPEQPGNGQPVEDAMERTLTPVAGDAEQATRPVGDLVENLTGLAGQPPTGGGSDGEQPDGHSADQSSGGPAAEGSAHPGATDQNAGSGTRADGYESARGDSGQGLPPGGSRDGRAPAHVPTAPSGHASQSAGDGSGHRGGGDTQAAAWTDTTGFDLPAGGVSAASESPLRERPSEVLELPG